MNITCSEISRLLPIARRRVAAVLVSWVQRILGNEVLKRDVFRTRYSRRALVCYLPEAFNGGLLPKYHSNFTECYMAAKALHRLGYSVDCASRGKTGIDYSVYEVVYGINCASFAASFTADKKVAPLRIFYSVGAHTFYNFGVTAERCKEFYERHGCWLLGSNHYIPGNGMNYYSVHFSDAVICLGDQFVLDKFCEIDGFSKKFRLLPAFFFPVVKSLPDKDFAKCRDTVLWFGSGSMQHKGLDIALDFVIKNPRFTLHVCGGSRQDDEFWRYYMPKIAKNNNIHIHGFVNIESEEFFHVLEQCAILINPSLSESGAVAVLNVLGNGALLPVYSRGTALDLASVGVEVPEVSYDAFEQAMFSVSAMSADEIEKKAIAAHSRVCENYTIERYEESLFGHIKDIIEKNNNNEKI